MTKISSPSWRCAVVAIVLTLIQTTGLSQGPTNKSLIVDKGRKVIDASSVSDRPLKEGAPESVLRIRWVGAQPGPRISGVHELPGRSNYYNGRDTTKWKTNVPRYAQVRLRWIPRSVALGRNFAPKSAPTEAFARQLLE